jgi:hypothetical protein
VLAVANAASASAITAENVFMVYLLVSGCSLSVIDQLNSRYSGDTRRTEISLCYRYDSCGLSGLCRREHIHRCDDADADQQILAALPVQHVQDKKIDTIVERYRINTN